MHDIAVLRDLLERVRAAKGSDRELDCLIWAEMHDRNVRYESGKMLAKSRRPPHDDCMLGFVDPGRVSRDFYRASNYDPPVPEYTRLLDDAVALVERGMPYPILGAAIALIEAMLSALIALAERDGNGASGG